MLDTPDILEASGQPSRDALVSIAGLRVEFETPQTYEGKDLLTAHKGMNISPAEFMAVLDDALAAMDKNHVGLAEQQEVLFAFYSMRSQIVQV